MKTGDCVLQLVSGTGQKYAVPVHPELSRFWSKDFIIVKNNFLVPVALNKFGKYSIYDVCLYDIQFNKFRSGILAHNTYSLKLSTYTYDLTQNCKGSLFRPIKPSCLRIVIDNFPKYVPVPMYYLSGAYYQDNTKYLLLLHNVFYSLFNVHDQMNEFVKIYVNHICLNTNTTLGVSNDYTLRLPNTGYTTLYNEYLSKFDENINFRDICYNEPSSSDIKSEFDLSLSKFRAAVPVEIPDPEYVIVLNYAYYDKDRDTNVVSIITELNSYISQKLPNTTIINDTYIGNEINDVVINNLSAQYSLITNTGVKVLDGFRVVRSWPIGLYMSMLKIY